MLAEYAITAGVFDRAAPEAQELQGQSLLQLLHAIGETGIVGSLFDNDWTAEVERRYRNLGPPFRQMVREALQRLYDRGRVVRRQAEGHDLPADDRGWLEEAIRSHQRSAFDTIVTCQPSLRGGEPACTRAIEELGREPALLHRPRTISVTRSTAGFRAALVPVLRYARSAILIDPHLGNSVLQGDARFLQALGVIDECLFVDVVRRVPLSLLEVHTLEYGAVAGAPPAVLLGRLQGVLPRVRGAQVRCRVVLWREQASGKRFHNRRILTNHAGISCPWGIDIHDNPGSQAGEDEWALLDYDVRVRISQDFQLNTTPYQLVWKREL